MLTKDTDLLDFRQGQFRELQLAAVRLSGDTSRIVHALTVFVLFWLKDERNSKCLEALGLTSRLDSLGDWGLHLNVTNDRWLIKMTSQHL